MAGDDVDFPPTHEDKHIPSSSGNTAPKKRIREMDETMDEAMDQSMDQTMDQTIDLKMDHKIDQKTSCELCKTRKVKCDRAEPACSWCARHNRTCVYLKRQPPGSRTRINAELEIKVNRIDELLRALGRRVEDHIAHDHAASHSHAGGGGSFTAIQSPSIASQAISSPTSNFRADIGSVLGSFGGSSDANRSSSALPYDGDQTPRSQSASMIWQSRSDVGIESSGHINSSSGNKNRNSNSSTSNGNDAEIGDPNEDRGLSSDVLGYQRFPSLRSLKAELPPHDMLYTLVDLYFKHCNTWCPILDRKTIFGTFFGATSLEEQDRVLLHAIVTTTLRFSKDPRLTPEMRDYYHSSSKQVVRLYAMDHVTVPALRALVIVSLDEFGTSNGPRAWNMLAMVAQNVKQLGLCEEVSVYLAPSTLDAPQGTSMNQLTAILRPDSWIEDEGRRRLCWVVYLLDRYATIGAASPQFLLEDDKMRRFLPCSYDLFSKNVPVQTRSSVACLAVGGVAAVDAADAGGGPGIVNRVEHMGSFSYHCELLRILSSIYDFLRTPMDITSSGDMARWRNTYQALDATLDGWLRGLPSEFSKISALCHSDPASRVSNWFMLHSAYVTAVVRLHSAVAYPIARSTLFMPSQVAIQRCLSAVHSLADIARDLREANGLDLLGPPFAFSLWVAASCLLVHASTSEGSTIDSRIDVLIDTLRYVGQHWEVANNYAVVLARVVQRARHGETTLASMRRSALDLHALTSTTRQSGSEPMSTHVTSLCELDSIDVFSFFMYPRMPEPLRVAVGGHGGHSGQMSNIWSPQLPGLAGGLYRAAPHPVSKPDWARLGTPDGSSLRGDDGRAISDKGPPDFWGGTLYNGL